MIIAQSAAVSIGFVLDAIFGDPDFKLHPIRLIGYLISLLEKVMRRIFTKNERLGGAVMAICVLIICGGVPFAILFFAYRLNYFFGIAIESVICYFMLAAKSLKQAGMSVYKPLKNGDVDGARKSVSMIVGRDTESLDDMGITKAAVETVAENTSDGVIAPLIYMAIGGGVLGCVYKAINTMDSMVGYKNDRYINFGRFAAKLDDIANYIPSRISAYLMIFASKIMGYNSRNAYRIFKRDSRNHASPNSAQTESVVAGALEIQLAGDAYYFGKLYKKPFIGDSIKPIKYDNIADSIKLMYMTSVISAVLFVGLKVAVGVVYGI
ncbi:MAG: adenosylcobinamide-phosphate synthase CbiB [Clostridia bacterium]